MHYLVAIALWFAAAACSPVSAQISNGRVHIVVLNDQSSVYSDSGGRGSVVAAELAVEEVGGRAAGAPVEVVGADHQNKADIGAAIARRLIDTEGADAFFDISNSSVSLAVQEITRRTGKVVVHVGSGSADLYNRDCSPTGALWLYDTAALAKGLVRSLYDEDHRRWFMLVADYAFGDSMQSAMTAAVQAAGGQVVGTVRHPLATADFSSFLLQASGRIPDVLAFLNAGADSINSVRQANEFGLMRPGMRIAVPIFTILNVKSLGPALAQGTTFLNGYHWDRDEPSRAFAKRFAARMNRPPTHIQAGVYSAVRHYLRAVTSVGSDDGLTVMNEMKRLPVQDMMTSGAQLRADGRLMRDMLIMEAKAPKHVTGEWDLLDVRGVVKAEDVIPPLEAGTCPFTRKP